MYWCYVQRGKFTEGDASRKGLRDKCQGGKSFSPPYIPLLFCPIFFSTNASFIHPHSSLLSPSNLLPPRSLLTLFFSLFLQSFFHSFSVQLPLLLTSLFYLLLPTSRLLQAFPSPPSPPYTFSLRSSPVPGSKLR